MLGSLIDLVRSSFSDLGFLAVFCVGRVFVLYFVSFLMDGMCIVCLCFCFKFIFIVCILYTDFEVWAEVPPRSFLVMLDYLDCFIPSLEDLGSKWKLSIDCPISSGGLGLLFDGSHMAIFSTLVARLEIVVLWRLRLVSRMVRLMMRVCVWSVVIVAVYD